LGVEAGDWGAAEQYVVIENGQPKIKKPHSIGQRVSRILSDYEKKPETDLVRRWENIDEYIRVRVEEELGEMPEATLDDIPEERAINYACRDADATLRLGPILIEKIDEMELGQVALIDHSVLPMAERMQSNGMRTNIPHFEELADRCTRMMEEKKEEIRRLTGASINPDSGDQVAALIFDQLHLDKKVTHRLKQTKSKKRLSTNDKTLEALRRVHPVVPIISDYREISKVRNSFAITIPRRTGRDGRVRCNIRTTRVSSGRFSATKPNLLAIPVRSKLGQEVRRGFVAKDGCALGTWDLDQIEMRYMADESQDPLLCGLFRDNTRDVHSETAARIFGLETYESKDKKERYRNVENMKHRYPAKRVGFGVITGITEVGLLDQMYLADTGREWTEDDCAEMIGEWFKIYKGVRVYMDACRAEARRNGYVRDRWGRIRYLPGVHSPISKIREEALRQSHSHKIQSGAQGIMKMGMATIWGYMKNWWWPEGWYVEPVLQVHDELILEVQDDEEIKGVVSAACVDALTTTTRLSVPLGAKGAYGYNWGDLEK
jgi:DNA polymerase I